MAKCWCGANHSKGDARNGEVKHWVANWKLYWLRGGELPEPSGESKKE
jgi:hypothetical protein